MQDGLEERTLGTDVGENPSIKIEKMTYRSPGTISVPAQNSTGGGGEQVTDEVATAASATIARLELALAESQRLAAAKLDQVQRTAREDSEQARLLAQQQLRTATETAQKQVGSALAGFTAEREQYFAEVEQEVVRLALAIAGRILHRETLLDPMLLTGAVRVALGQLGETTVVRLRCPADQAEKWRESLCRDSAPPRGPEIVPDRFMEVGDCVLETEVGSVDLGIRAQLEEIERGFFDLLERRPASAGAVRSGFEDSISRTKTTR